jgi:glycosyltransferase involved in cell wall biosynthesis
VEQEIKRKLNLKILHLLPTSKLSGAEKVVLDIAKKQLQQGDKVTVICAGEPLASVYRVNNINVYVLNLMNFSIKTFRDLKDYIAKEDFDILHAHDLRASVYISILKKSTFKKKVSHIHLAYDWMKGFNKFKIIDRLIRNRFDFSIACSNNVFEYYLKNNPSGITKLRALPNAFDFQQLVKFSGPENRMTSLKDKVSENDFVIGYVGRLSKIKRVDNLIKAFAHLCKFYKITNAKLVIVGDGVCASELKDLVKQLAIEEKVIFTGHQPDPLDYLNYFDVAALFSENEGLPLSILEAMAMRKIVVTTQIAGLRELIRDEENGYFLKENYTIEEAAELLNKIRMNYKELDNIRANAYQTIKENFNMDNYIIKLNQIYLQ